MRLDARKFVLLIAWVHRPDLLSRRCAQHFDDFDELIDATLTGEEGLAKHELSHHTARGPDVNVCGVVCRAKNKLWGTIVARADVGHVGLPCDQDLS